MGHHHTHTPTKGREGSPASSNETSRLKVLSAPNVPDESISCLFSQHPLSVSGSEAALPQHPTHPWSPLFGLPDQGSERESRRRKAWTEPRQLRPETPSPSGPPRASLSLRAPGGAPGSRFPHMLSLHRAIGFSWHPLLFEAFRAPLNPSHRVEMLGVGRKRGSFCPPGKGLLSEMFSKVPGQEVGE